MGSALPPAPGGSELNGQSRAPPPSLVLVQGASLSLRIHWTFVRPLTHIPPNKYRRVLHSVPMPCYPLDGNTDQDTG